MTKLSIFWHTLQFMFAWQYMGNKTSTAPTLILPRNICVSHFNRSEIGILPKNRYYLQLYLKKYTLIIKRTCQIAL